MLSISRNVRLSVRPSVRLSVCSLLRYRLNVFLSPLSEVGCPKFLEIRNPWGKVMERSGLRFEHFCLEVVLNRRAILPYKTCWKPRFPMDERPLVEGCNADFSISLDVFEFLRFGWFFPFFKKMGFWVFYYPHRSRDALSPVCGILYIKPLIGMHMGDAESLDVCGW